MQAFCNSQFGLSEQAMDGGSADSITFRKLSQAVSSLPIPQDRGAIKNQRCSSDVPAFEFRPPHAGTNSLDDQAALQLRDRTDDDHHCPAQRPTGIDLLLEADELDVEPVQFIEHLEEVFYRPRDPIRSPDQTDIEVVAACIPHHGIESRPASLRAADRVGVGLDDLIAALFGHLSQVIELGFMVLIESRDPHI